ncbi:MAG TPA: phenylalanine--tRNA ligase subunit alpha [Candidatus Azoamicus sp. MARI]
MTDYTIQQLLNNFLIEIKTVKNLIELDKIRILYLGRKGKLNENFKDIAILTVNEKKIYGSKANEIKTNITNIIKEKEKELINNKNINTNIDITLPGFNETFGSEHVISKTIKEIEYFFTTCGFEVLNSKEIEKTYYNFDALNINKEHPSRSEKETFYLKKNILLRTHTSNMQIHAMEKKKIPIKAISYGKVFRKDSDASHTPMFHQMEGFIIDKNLSIGNLKFIITKFLNFFFEKNMKINMRPSYFPFTEPSMEVDIECISCLGKKCNLCKHTGWIEILGCGMIHPTVLKNCNINNNLYTGLAFGLGVERLSMIKYKITDIRSFYENNLSFLNQF